MNKKGIKAHTNKIIAIFKLKSPKLIKEVQKLIGCIVFLSKFISRARDRCHHLFKALR